MISLLPTELFHSILKAIQTMLIYPPVLQEVSLSIPKSIPNATRKMDATALEDLGEEASSLFTSALTTENRLAMSQRMCIQYSKQLQTGTESMLPSFIHTLPTGKETGTYLALDVGGSTFRVALVELSGHACGNTALKILRSSVSPIDDTIRRLQSTLFFDWMAQKIEAMLVAAPEGIQAQDTIPIGLAWSFPIEQTSPGSGKIRGMGKGFHCSHDAIGQDLGDLLIAACARRGLKIRVDAIVNDSSAALLARSYVEPSTSMSLILGTGTNAAVHLPLSFIGEERLRTRAPSWHSQAERVITNTELSMFGKGILPETRWDERLNAAHRIPDFQPLEYMTTGRYLGEIFRLVILEAIDTAGLFEGVVSSTLLDPYSLDTAILGALEADTSPALATSALVLQRTWTLPARPSPAELAFLRTVVEAISTRAAAYLAVAIHALWTLQKKSDAGTTDCLRTSNTSIACTGSVIIKYPNLRTRCQDYIAEMIKSASPAIGEKDQETVALETIEDAAILGAAVAVALNG